MYFPGIRFTLVCASSSAFYLQLFYNTYMCSGKVSLIARLLDVCITKDNCHWVGQWGPFREERTVDFDTDILQNHSGYLDLSCISSVIQWEGLSCSWRFHCKNACHQTGLTHICFQITKSALRVNTKDFSYWNWYLIH